MHEIDDECNIWIKNNSETFWRKNNIHIKRLVQYQNQIIVTQPGTYHWVESSGRSIHMAFNRFILTEKQISESESRIRKVIKRIN